MIEDKPILSEKDILLTRIDSILREFELKESDIPLEHDYWNLLNKYRALIDGEEWRKHIKEEDPLKKKLGLV